MTEEIKVDNIDIAKIIAENEALKNKLSSLETKAQETRQETINPYEDYLKEKSELEAKKNKDDILLKEFSNISFNYQTLFLDAIERIEKMHSFSLGEKIEQMAIDTIIKANPSDDTRRKLEELKDVSVLDSKGAKKFMYLEAIKKIKEVAEAPTKAGGRADYNRLSTDEMKRLSSELFDGKTKNNAKIKAKNYGLI